MVFKKFRFNIIWKIIFLSISISALLACIYFTNWKITAVLLLCFVIYQVYALIIFTETINRDLGRFLIGIKHRDFSQSFTTEQPLNKNLPELKSVLGEINYEFQKISNEKEINYRYLQTVLEHISTGLIAFDEQGEITLYNQAARQILKLMHLKNIKSLEKHYPELGFLIENIRPGEKELLALRIKEEPLHLSITATELKTGNQVNKIIGLQNIKKELDINELEAWQKLISVLTHEIMNSVTPISSLANSTLHLFKEENNKQVIQSEDVDDIHMALSTIEKRSHGLLNFVDVYRNLSRIPKPNFTEFKILELLEQVQNLFKETLMKENIQLEIKSEPLIVKADLNLLEQVLINLMLNAKDAVSTVDKKIITIVCYRKEDNTILEVRDTGIGIEADVLDKIFIPFFTTKAKGSGIGLSLTRQIMKVHNGSINVSSNKETGTVFTLIW